MPWKRAKRKETGKANTGTSPIPFMGCFVGEMTPCSHAETSHAVAVLRTPTKTTWDTAAGIAKTMVMDITDPAARSEGSSGIPSRFSTTATARKTTTTGHGPECMVACLDFLVRNKKRLRSRQKTQPRRPTLAMVMSLQAVMNRVLSSQRKTVSMSRRQKNLQQSLTGKDSNDSSPVQSVLFLNRLSHT